MEKDYDFAAKRIYHELEALFIDAYLKPVAKRREQKVVIMPSVQCLDLERIIIGRGFRPENVYCVEREKKFIDPMKDRLKELGFEKANVYHGDVRSFFKDHSELEFHLILLDYQGMYIEENSKTLEEIFYRRQLASGGVITTNFLGRRDKIIRNKYEIDTYARELVDKKVCKDTEISKFDYTKIDRKIVLNALGMGFRAVVCYINEVISILFSRKLAQEEIISDIKKREISEIRDNAITRDIITNAYDSRRVLFHEYKDKMIEKTEGKWESKLYRYPMYPIYTAKVLWQLFKLEVNSVREAKRQMLGQEQITSILPAYFPKKIFRGYYLSSGGKSTMYFDFFNFVNIKHPHNVQDNIILKKHLNVYANANNSRMNLLRNLPPRIKIDPENHVKQMFRENDTSIDFGDSNNKRKKHNYMR